MQTYPFSSILGWSASRYDKFDTCKRSYYYQYYTKFDTEFGTEKINALKHLTSVALETGNITHDVFKAILKRIQQSAEPLNRGKLKAYITQLTGFYCNSKKFAEVYYGQLPEVPVQQINDIVSELVLHYLDTERMDWMMRQPDELKKGWLIEPDGFGETRINGLKAYCKVDFLMPTEEGVFIFDWKTGKAYPGKHRKQMLGYALFAHTNLSFMIDNIYPVLCYLTESGREEAVALEPDSLRAFATAVKNETDEMYMYTTNTEKNIPRPKEDFPMTENTKICGYCEYRELCRR